MDVRHKVVDPNTAIRRLTETIVDQQTIIDIQRARIRCMLLSATAQSIGGPEFRWLGSVEASVRDRFLEERRVVRRQLAACVAEYKESEQT
jgi:hypothetical protein